MFFKKLPYIVGGLLLGCASTAPEPELYKPAVKQEVRSDVVEKYRRALEADHMVAKHLNAITEMYFNTEGARAVQIEGDNRPLVRINIYDRNLPPITPQELEIIAAFIDSIYESEDK